MPRRYAKKKRYGRKRKPKRKRKYRKSRKKRQSTKRIAAVVRTNAKDISALEKKVKNTTSAFRKKYSDTSRLACNAKFANWSPWLIFNLALLQDVVEDIPAVVWDANLGQFQTASGNPMASFSKDLYLKTSSCIDIRNNCSTDADIEIWLAEPRLAGLSDPQLDMNIAAASDVTTAYGGTGEPPTAQRDPFLTISDLPTLKSGWKLKRLEKFSLTPGQQRRDCAKTSQKIDFDYGKSASIITNGDEYAPGFGCQFYFFRIIGQLGHNDDTSAVVTTAAEVDFQMRRHISVHYPAMGSAIRTQHSFTSQAIPANPVQFGQKYIPFTPINHVCDYTGVPTNEIGAAFAAQAAQINTLEGLTTDIRLYTSNTDINTAAIRGRGASVTPGALKTTFP